MKNPEKKNGLPPGYFYGLSNAVALLKLEWTVLKTPQPHKFIKWRCGSAERARWKIGRPVFLPWPCTKVHGLRLSYQTHHAIKGPEETVASNHSPQRWPWAFLPYFYFSEKRLTEITHLPIIRLHRIIKMSHLFAFCLNYINWKS